MESEPGIEMDAEYYGSLLEVTLTDLTREDLKKTGTFVFSISPNFNIFISKKSHDFLSDKYGVRGDETLTEGYLRIRSNGTPEVTFKHDVFQPVPAFKGSKNELEALKDGIRKKLIDELK